ncbi:MULTISPECIES: hypothetical protein [unclassified Oceanispirochaeta]|uniref:hypothetical protein n=1 Tax=unclassified Oceanispirochaeta TaxID=2635722 RepID=UPI000E08D7E3|nr:MULTISPECIES: hypothetical protein [unclassified Oceanispirochaeta]MBF9017830.1 hypothetical protein [Oceanispirochaeta sp. M2]NPD74290.1 hypothetical protein [Oceanispirochaeta sp. M1]RDG29880.1 hypothetical protein DV872_19505 [Oceanispirochaeta sp. M1]
MKKGFIFFLLLQAAFLTAADNYQIHNLRFMPPEYYVGDTVEMSFILKTDQVHDFTVPEEFPDPGWLNILSMDIESKGSETEVTIRLIPYYPGTRALPPVDLGGLIVDDLKIFTSTLLNLESSRELEGVQSPLLIPGTRAVGALIVSLLLALPILIVMVYRFIRHRTGEIVKTYKINLPYRQFQRLVRKIRRSMVNMPEKEFYMTFTGGLKKYLSTRFHHDLSSSTTSEIENLLGRSRIHDTLALSLVNLFHRVDRVKFAGDKMLYSDREQLLSEVEEVSEALEEWRKKHADI